VVKPWPFKLICLKFEPTLDYCTMGKRGVMLWIYLTTLLWQKSKIKYLFSEYFINIILICYVFFKIYMCILHIYNSEVKGHDIFLWDANLTPTVQVLKVNYIPWQKYCIVHFHSFLPLGRINMKYAGPAAVFFTTSDWKYMYFNFKMALTKSVSFLADYCTFYIY
jgi:hypothetical protein